MSLKDLLGFELFHAGDFWDRLKDDPKRLLLGVDPWSTKIWNSVLGRDDDPLVDQMGGPWAGSTISAFGNTDGGVFERAQQAGIDTDTAEGMHNAAHIVAGIFGGAGAAGALGGGAAGSGSLAPVTTPNVAATAPTTVSVGGATSGAGVPSGGSLATFDFPGAIQATGGEQGFLGGLLEGGLPRSGLGGQGLLGPRQQQQSSLMERAMMLDQERRARLRAAQIAQQQARQGLLR